MLAARGTGGRLVLIPALEEALRLPAVLAGVREAAPGYEIAVVDDGSSDATREVARAAGVHVLRHAVNLGYGAALQTGYRFALERRASVVVQLDADGQHHPGCIEDLAAPVLAGSADLVIGSRFLGEKPYRMGAVRGLGRSLFRVVARLAGLRITDPTSGFQALGPRALELYAHDFFPSDYPDVDVLIAAARAGIRLEERAVEMRPSERASRLHGGLRDLYYVYKMLLATWSALLR